MWNDRSVYFNFGQKLAPDHLNSLSDYARARDSFLQHVLSGGYGIVKDFSDELKISISPTDPLTLIVGKGAAVNKEGELLILCEPQMLSLRGRGRSQPHTYFLSIYPDTILENIVHDPEVPEFKGYKHRSQVSQIQLSKQVPTNGIVLASVQLDSSVRELTLASEVEVQSNIDNPDFLIGKIDTSKQNYVFSFNRYFIGRELHRQAQFCLRDFRAMLTQLASIFPGIKKLQRCEDRSLLLEAELADRFFISSKIQFLLTEMHKSLMEVLEEVRNLTRQNSSYNATLWTELFSLGEQISVQITNDKEHSAQFKTLAEMALLIRSQVLNMNSAESKKTLVLESLRDIIAYPFGYHLKHSFGGVIYKRAVQLDISSFKDAVEFKTDFSVQRMVSADLGQGQTETVRGQFVGSGQIEATLSGLTNNKDSIIMIRGFKRRGNLEVGVRLNGQVISSQSIQAADHINQVVNIGFYASGEHVMNGQNKITLDIKKTDLDFGLLSLCVYQEAGVEEI